ncbi:calcium/sodium antiporter [Rhodocaloribacter litoris]|uniref:calcium/sodium antiporter n=1 Tax=Rhodocaloribacter litoris TaxID=2558931 RepID=UPI001421C839|nr:calcium/sodium antiporter [Rhodocaloribacter litoris]QXD14712.1 calcium/sodium antiporter [Rhodocaloribacter litoris]GIV59197.1 MAG: K+-dependent Na+/Ca+ exchanger [Rhodothermaceae bacterium]
MLLQILLFLAGLGALYYGAEWLIKGAMSLALRFGIRRMVVGLTVVALGTSMPEFLVNFFAALWDEDSLALGNIVGSNIANIALILGMSAMVYPLAVQPPALRKEYPLMMLVMAAFYAMAWDGTISRLDGVLLVAGLAGFLAYLVLDARTETSKAEVARELLAATDGNTPVELLPMWKKSLYLLGGVAGLALGARLMVSAAVNIAEALQISHVVIGLTVVAVGTSLPELAASVLCAFRREPEMTVGNILGSNLLNILFVVGLIALIRPLHVEADAITIHFPVMMAFGLLLLPLAWTGYRISRLEGTVLVLGFTGYMVYLALPYL